MARNDHYVAKTYLKHFGDGQKGGMLNAYRKSDGANFPCWPDNVCHEWDGDLNEEWLPQYPEMLGDIRETFERRWNAAIDGLAAERITNKERFTISAYMAQLFTCTPGWRRIGVQMHDQGATTYLSIAKKRAIRKGDPNFPVDAVELLEEGKAKIEHHPGYIKAVDTTQLISQGWTLYNQDWTILINETEHPFITSDNPGAVYQPDNLGDTATRYLPVTPRLCICIKGKWKREKPFDLGKAPDGKITHRTASEKLAMTINRHQARCAEELVFSSIATSGLAQLVRNAARYRVEVENIHQYTPDEKVAIAGAILRVRKFR